MTIPTERQLRLARYHWDQARIATITSAVRCGALVPCDPASGQWFRWATRADLRWAHPLDLRGEARDD